jgi:hypothetical protein
MTVLRNDRVFKLVLTGIERLAQGLVVLDLVIVVSHSTSSTRHGLIVDLKTLRAFRVSQVESAK